MKKFEEFVNEVSTFDSIADHLRNKKISDAVYKKEQCHYY